MRIGVIADIHANLPALHAVLEAMPQVDRILCAGDMVGYYAEPNEVCERVREVGALCVRGNHDAYVTDALTPRGDRRLLYRTDWTRDVLTAENKRWLESLPAENRISLDGIAIILRHASPWDEETYLYPDSEQIREIELKQDEVLVLGHTHWPMVHRAGNGLIVNPGSVGQPRDYNPKASFAIIDSASRTISNHRVAYDVPGYTLRLTQLGWAPDTIAILSREKWSGSDPLGNAVNGA